MKKLECPINTEYVLISIVDGQSCSTLSDFYKIIADHFLFPDYFSFNLDSLNELLSDLSWLNKQNIILVITNFSHFLNTESKHTRNIIEQILDYAAMNNYPISFDWYYQ